MSYTLTLRRRLEDASLEELHLACQVTSARVGDRDLTEEEVSLLVLDAEMQANGTMLQTPRQSVRLWFNES